MYQKLKKYNFGFFRWTVDEFKGESTIPKENTERHQNLFIDKNCLKFKKPKKFVIFMLNEQSPDFFLSHEKTKARLDDLIKRRRLDKMSACFSSHNDNFDHYAKCLYSFERVLAEKCKYIQFSDEFLRMHYEKCLKSKSQKDVPACLDRIKTLSNTIFEKLEDEIGTIQ